MPEPPPPTRIPDSHKSAFWIWGVTAMIMREPLAVLVRLISNEGIATQSTQLACLRAGLILMILSRQFLAAGIYFDRVYLLPDSATRFPSRNYPLDFITRLIEMLVAVAASTAVALDSPSPGGLSPFLILTGVMLLLESVWLLAARAANYSTVSEIAPGARANLHAFLLCSVLYFSSRAAGSGVRQTEMLVLFAVLLFTGYQLAGQVRAYGRA